jgi:hypothetical protein
VLIALFALPRPAFAECVTLDVRSVANESALVLSGTVNRIESAAVSKWGSEVVWLDVDRIWKGSPGKEVAIYNFKRTVEPFIFSTGTKYLVFAHRQTAEERADFGLPAMGPATYGVGTCGGGTRLYESAKGEIAVLGAGRAPS